MIGVPAPISGDPTLRFRNDGKPAAVLRLVRDGCYI